MAAAAPSGGWLIAALRPTPASVRHLPDERALVAVAGGVDEQEVRFLDRWVERIPFTDSELATIADSMPLTAAVHANLDRWAPDIHLDEAGESAVLGPFAAIFTIHHQTDFLVLLLEALRLGLDPNLVTVIDKQYRYAASNRVDVTVVEKLGIRVFTYEELTSGRAIEDHIRRIAADRQQRHSTTWRQTIIVDDGGYVLPVLHERFSVYLNLFAGVVEQTASGIWALQPFEADLRVPVFSVAESDLKQTVEAHGVAMAAVLNTRTLLPNVKFSAQHAVVVGYGRIGKALAKVLRSMHMRVAVVDSDRGARVSAAEDGFATAPTLVDAIDREQPQFVFACAGKKCVDRKALDALRGNCVLVSSTSRDYAFDKDHLARNFEGLPYGTIGTTYKSAAARLFLVADGFPVNFHWAESMPNAQSDLVMASMLLGAIHLAASSPPWPPGNDRDRANFYLNEGTLLDDFYNLHHPLPPLRSQS